MTDTVILTFTFPKVEPYLTDFFLSCDKQTDRLFDVLIIDEGTPSIKQIVNNFSRLNVTVVNHQGSISENRVYGLDLAKKMGYANIILADSDDFFSGNRVQKTKELLNNHAILANEVSLVNIKGEEIVPLYFSHRLDNNNVIDFTFIKEKNILGFSNSAFKTKLLPDDLNIPRDLCVVDWYFFTLLLSKGYKAIFTNEIITYYRQYDDNMIGINNETADNYKKKLILKAKHYRELAGFISVFEPLSLKYEKADQLGNEQIESLLRSDLNKYPFWWENINL